VFIIDESFHQFDKRRIDQYAKFVSALNSNPDSIVVAPENDKSLAEREGHELSVSYTKLPWKDKNYQARLIMRLRHDVITYSTSLFRALSFAAFHLEDRARIDSASRLNFHASGKIVAAQLGFDPETIIKPDVGTWMSGHYVAPADGRFLGFLVDTYGEIVPLVEADEIGIVLYWLWVSDQITAVDLSSRLAPFFPHDAPPERAG
jgi:hypothetical protein